MFWIIISGMVHSELLLGCFSPDIKDVIRESRLFEVWVMIQVIERSPLSSQTLFNGIRQWILQTTCRYDVDKARKNVTMMYFNTAFKGWQGTLYIHAQLHMARYGEDFFKPNNPGPLQC